MPDRRGDRPQGVGSDIDVLAAFAAQEAEALFCVVPFHLAGRHSLILFVSNGSNQTSLVIFEINRNSLEAFVSLHPSVLGVGAAVAGSQ